MKLSIIALTIALSSQAYAVDMYKCILDGVPYKKSPVVTVAVEQLRTGDVVKLEFTQTSQSYKRILISDVEDKTDDVLALYENKDKSVILSFYMDESDAMGLMEGSITSPVMNGNVRCIMSDN